MRIDWDVPIEMDDGVVLRADVFRPDDDGRYPVIMNHGPYGKGLSFQEGYPSQWQRLVECYPDALEGSSNRYQNWEAVDPEKWVPHGYACVRIDCRGCGRSPGFLEPWSPRETRDYHDCIEWAAAQPWCSGKVGLSGISYYAMNQWQVAGLRPPHLAAMVPWEGAADFYRDVFYHGGILCTNWRNWYHKQVKSVQHGLGKNGPVNPNNGELVCGQETLSDEELARNRCDLGHDIEAHPLDDEYHRSRTVDWGRVEVPFLSAGSWGGQALHLRGNTEAFTQAASPRKWLEIHGMEHWTLYYASHGVDLQKQFFDHFLKGLDNGWEEKPPVLLNVRTLTGFVSRGEQEWPLARTQWTPLFLDATDTSLCDERPAAEGSISFDATGDGVTLLGDPLEQETEITGPVAAKLFVSSTTTDADLFLVLRVFAPDGNEVTFQGSNDPRTSVGKGWLRVSHRDLDPRLSRPERPYHTHTNPQPLVPGQVYEVDIEIWPTCVVIPAGYRIGLTVLGKDFDHGGPSERLANFIVELRGSGPYLHDEPRDRPPEVFGGTTTLHTGGQYVARLTLPVIPGEES
jgi:predicted acyl esterase